MENPTASFPILTQGDCFAVLSSGTLPKASLIIVDPPYGTTRNPWDSAPDMAALMALLWRNVAENAVIVCFGQGMFTADVMSANRRSWRYNLIWEKSQPSGFLNSHRMPLRAHEDMMVFCKGKPVYNPQKTSGHPRKVSSGNGARTSNYGSYRPHSYDSTERMPRSVIKFAKDTQKSRLSPTQKPEALMEWLIKTYSNEGGVVLDPMMGSGTVGVACRNTLRNFVGIEKDSAAFTTASARIVTDPIAIPAKEAE